MPTIHASIRQIRPSHDHKEDLPGGEVQGAGPTYDAAMAEVFSKVPDGYQVLSVLVQR